MKTNVILPFPKAISFTVTNRCNLRCKMCGQWGPEGYMNQTPANGDLPVDIWKRLVDEVAEHGEAWIGIRGGEPFLYPGMIDLLAYLAQKELPVSIDTNGMLLGKYARDIVNLGVRNINLSIDGPARIHDEVRGVQGGFHRIAEGVAEITRLSREAGKTSPIGCIVFTISPWSCKGLAEMPDVARRLGVPAIAIVPYYYFDRAAGARYEHVMREELGCEAFSWKGFHNETSGVDPEEFLALLREYKVNLRDIQAIPYMDYSEEAYRKWFSNCTAPVDTYTCQNPWRLIDIQPNGNANFCVDFPDYVIGNIVDHTIEELWNNEHAKRFRQLIEKGPLPVCHRCGAKYMSRMEGDG